MNVVFDYIDATNKAILETIRLSGFKPVVWNRGQKGAFDMFDEVKPVLAILNPEWIDRATYKSLGNHNTKLAFATDTTKSEHAFKLMIENRVGYKVEKQPYANLYSFYNRGLVTDPMFECAYLIISDWIEGEHIHKAINSFDYSSDVKIIGHNYVSHPWYMGFVAPQEEAVALTSAGTIILNDGNLNEYNAYLSGAKVLNLDTNEVVNKTVADIWKEKRTSAHLVQEILEGVGLTDKASDAQAVIERYKDEFSGLIG